MTRLQSFALQQTLPSAASSERSISALASGASMAAEASISVGLCDDSKNRAAVRMEIKGPNAAKICALLQAKVQEKGAKKPTGAAP